MDFKITGELQLSRIINVEEKPEKIVRNYIENIEYEDYEIQIGYRIDEVVNNTLFFSLIVDANIDADDADEALGIVENCLLYELECKCEFNELEVESEEDESLYEDWFSDEE